MAFTCECHCWFVKDQRLSSAPPADTILSPHPVESNCFADAESVPSEVPGGFGF